jgi:hypothetical protein
MSSGREVACHEHQTDRLQETLDYLKRTRSELRMLRKVRAYRDHVQVVDVNGDWFEVRGLGYPDADIEPVLRAVNAAFNRDTIHAAVNDEFKELNAGRRYPWAADRVM